MKQSYVQNLSQLHHEEPERLLRRCSGFFIINLKPVYNWVAVSASDNDQVKASGKEVRSKYIIFICVCLCVATMLQKAKSKSRIFALFLLYIYNIYI